MSVVIKSAETATYCYESCYFTKQSRINFMAFHGSITEISEKNTTLLTLFWTKANNDYVVLLFYLETSRSLPGITSASIFLKTREVWLRADQYWNISFAVDRSDRPEVADWLIPLMKMLCHLPEKGRTAACLEPHQHLLEFTY